MEEKELIERILKYGDTRCYKEIVERHSGMVFSKVIRLVKREDIAKDITQQAFIRAYSRLGCWRGGAFGAWINAIATHLALNFLSREQRYYMESMDDKRLQDVADDYSDEHEQLLSAMDAAISKLPDIDRQILLLHYYKGKKTAEIATLLGLSGSNVLVKLHRIREQLKKQIEYERNK
jgi:RNA polymerase sigma-70 factor (ECF subfamily)